MNDARELYVACYPRLVRALTLAAGDSAEAEDVVQEAFARLVPRWSKIADYDDPEAWVRKVAFRLLSTRRHRARNVLTHLRTHDPDRVEGPSGAAVDIQRGLATLPLPQRQVVVLHHLLDLPVEDVAAELGVPVGTVKSRLSRAREALAPLLREEIHHE